MRRIGCTSRLAGQAIYAAAGLAVVSSLAVAQGEVSRSERADSTSGVYHSVPVEQMLTETAGGNSGVFFDFIGTDGTFCPSGSTPEGEACVSPPVVPDTFNGGCNASSTAPPLTPIAVGQIICGQSVRASGSRDTDWYEVQITTPGNYIVEVLTNGASPAGGIIGNSSGPLVNPVCADVTVVSGFITGAGGGRSAPQALVAGTYWLFASSSTSADQACFEYTIRIDTEEAFWGACCQAGNVCSVVSESDCQGLGGIFQGAGIDCAEAECPEFFQPENSDCFAAYVITAEDMGGAAIAGTNLGATAEFGLPACGGPLEGPAVWYVYDAQTLGAQTVTVSTCETTSLPEDDRISDTVLNVFTNSIPDFCLGVFCCKAGNDDGSDEECDAYSQASFCADADVDGGKYFILVSGFESEIGNFLLTVSGDGEPCDSMVCVQCQAGDTAEGESCPSEPDTFNGGCNSTPNVFSSLSLNETICGTSATVNSLRDTDWYEIEITETGVYELTFQAGFSGIAGFAGDSEGAPVANPTCDTVENVVLSLTPEACVEASRLVSLNPGIYWIFVAPTVFEGINCPDDPECPGNGRYRFSLSEVPPLVACAVDCPANAVMECEECRDWQNYNEELETCNDGCANVEKFAAQAIECGDSVCGTIAAGFSLRDLDYYEIEVTNPNGATITASLQSAFDGLVFIVDASDCENIEVLGEIGVSLCDGSTIDAEPAVASVGPGTFHVIVTSLNFYNITCDNNANYVLTVTGDCGGASCACDGDLNGDCVVNADDLGILLNDFGCTGSCTADLNGDGVVNADDLGILLNSFGCAG